MDMKVCIYGAGGPVAAHAINALERSHWLRLTDINAEALQPYAQRHETMTVDVTDPQQVLAAADGMDALVNCTVIRDHPVESFRVNLLGAYNIMKAAISHSIKRIIQTGPHLTFGRYMSDYAFDFDIPDDVPPRPGTGLYFLTKYLGQEVCRVFAETHGIEVIALLFSALHDPNEERLKSGEGIGPFSVSWEDAGEAFRCALEAPSLPRPFEVFHIVADLPHGKYPNTKAKRLLGWQPKETFECQWRKPAGG